MNDMDGVSGYTAECIAQDRGRLSYKHNLEDSLRANPGVAEEKVRNKVLINTFSMAPEWGGYGDVLQHGRGLELVSDYVNRKVKRGAEEDWDLYEKAGQAVRRQLELDPFGINRPKRTIDVTTLEQQRKAAIGEMARQRDRLCGIK